MNNKNTKLKTWSIGTDFWIYLVRNGTKNQKKIKQSGISILSIINKSNKINNKWVFELRNFKEKGWSRTSISQAFDICSSLGIINNVEIKKEIYKYKIDQKLLELIKKIESSDVSEPNNKDNLLQSLINKIVENIKENVEKLYMTDSNIRDDFYFSFYQTLVYDKFKANLKQQKIYCNSDYKEIIKNSKRNMNDSVGDFERYYANFISFLNEDIKNNLLNVMNDKFGKDWEYKAQLDDLDMFSKSLAYKITDLEKDKFCSDKYKKEKEKNISFFNKAKDDYTDNSRYTFSLVMNTYSFLEKKGKILIPDYQRRYTWGLNENIFLITNLIEDIYMLNDNKKINLGNIIINYKSREGKETDYRIIDGQQRLTTLIIIYIAFYIFVKIINEKNEYNLQIEKPKFMNYLFETDQDIKREEFLNSFVNYNIKKRTKESNNEIDPYYNCYFECFSWFKRNLKNDQKKIKRMYHNLIFKIENTFTLSQFNKQKSGIQEEFQVFINTNTKREELNKIDIFKTTCLLLAQKENEISEIDQEEIMNFVKKFKNNKKNYFDNFFKFYLISIGLNFNDNQISKMVPLLNKQFNEFHKKQISNNKRSKVACFLKHINKYLDLWNFLNLKDDKVEQFKKIYDFKMVFAERTAIQPYLAMAIDKIIGIDNIDLLKGTRINKNTAREKDIYNKINLLRSILFAIEAYVIFWDLNYKGTSFGSQIAQVFNFCGNNLDVETFNTKLYENKKPKNNRHDFINWFRQERKGNVQKLRNFKSILNRIQITYDLFGGVDRFTIELKSEDYEKIKVGTDYDLEHIHPRSKKDMVDWDVDDIGNLVLLGHKANIKNSDRLLYETEPNNEYIKYDMYEKDARFLLFAFLDDGNNFNKNNISENNYKNWIKKHVEKRKELYINAIEKIYIDYAYKWIDGN